VRAAAAQLRSRSPCMSTATFFFSVPTSSWAAAGKGAYRSSCRSIDRSVTTLTSSISSPIFSERHVVSCLATQDGQTFGVAALCQLRHFWHPVPEKHPAAAVDQTARAARPARRARVLSEDQRDQLIHVATLSVSLRSLSTLGSNDPNCRSRDRVQRLQSKR
jgi:hypothetical protein